MLTYENMNIIESSLEVHFFFDSDFCPKLF